MTNYPCRLVDDKHMAFEGWWEEKRESMKLFSYECMKLMKIRQVQIVEDIDEPYGGKRG